MATLNYGWVPPTVGGSSGTWGTLLNTALDAIDASLKTVDNKTVMQRGDKGTTGGAVALDLTTQRYFTITPNAGVTFSFTNVPAGTLATAIMIRITNTAGQTITWPASVKWPAGTAPSLATAGTHLVSLVTDDDGVTWRGNALTSLA